MDAEGWVLAGGRSLRMGRDKAQVELAGRTLLGRMLEKLEALGVRARVAGLREPVGGVTAEVIPDAHPDCGPLSGMEIALGRSKAELVLVLGVDLPLLETEFLSWMLRRAATTGAMATIPVLLGKPQPLCAVYRGELIHGVRAALEAGDYKMTAAVERASPNDGIDCFAVERVAATGAWRSRRPLHWQFMNCNTPEELAMAEAMAEQAPIL
ncbi:MAG TPA: molybdenum cofactor guanylyltransferase [Acidobacteriaceae bacterium]|jgi:molybdopterin-guanine dinucleotide biosynthesis protein A